MRHRRIAALVLSAGVLLGSGALTACENEDTRELDKLQEDVGRDLDKLEDEVDKNN